MTASSELGSRPVAEAYLERVCFKIGPPALVGAELELFTSLPDGSRPSLDLLAAALGDHTPASLRPDSPALPLRSGNVVSVEPGGQLELSSAPAASADLVVDAMRRDTDRLQDLLAPYGVTLGTGGADVARDPERLLTLPRYCAMESRFDTVGPFGRAMMCNTAAVQISVDAGRDRAEIRDRWETLHAVGPALLAAFAATPVLAGVPAEPWASQRMRTWFELDRTRTRVPLGVDPVVDYARWALDVPLLCIRVGSRLQSPPRETTFAQWMAGALDDVVGPGERRPTTADLDYHLTTLFPLVRAGGHLEVRYLDGQPDGLWDVPIHAVAALVADESVRAAARAAVLGTENRWEDAARFGLADAALADAASAVLAVAAAASVGLVADRLQAAAERCAARLAPGESRSSTHAFTKEAAR